MQLTEYSKHDLKNIYLKLYLSEDYSLTEENSKKYYSILSDFKDSKLLEPDFRQKINNTLMKFNN